MHAMTTVVFDQQQPTHQKALSKLASDQIAWFASIRPDGRPHSVPVWFLWHEGTALIFSEERTQKIRNLRHDGHVVLTLESNGDGSDVVILDGTAAISGENATAWLPRIGDTYGTKYAGGIVGLGMDLSTMAAKFDQVIVFTPTKLTAW